MTADDLKKLDQAPQTGQALIYTMDKVFYESYNGIDKIKEIMKNKELLEVHLFDTQKEYRCITTESSRFPSGVIEAVISFNGSDEVTAYKEICKLENGEKMTVINHISYDENGMAAIDGYRLIPGEV